MAAGRSISQSSIRFGPFELRPLTGELCKDGQRLRISGQPLEILLILIVRAGEVVPRDELRDSLWTSDTFVDFEHSLNAAIKRLRVALEDDVSSPRYIETVPRRGYRFIGEVTETSSPSEAGAASATVIPFRNPELHPAINRSSALRSELAVLLLAILCFVGGLLWARIVAILGR